MIVSLFGFHGLNRLVSGIVADYSYIFLNLRKN